MKVSKPLRWHLVFFVSLLLAIWTGAFLFHLRPLEVSEINWWHYPWMVTVAFIAVLIVIVGNNVGKWWEEKR